MKHQFEEDATKRWIYISSTEKRVYSKLLICSQCGIKIRSDLMEFCQHPLTCEEFIVGRTLNE